MNKRRLLKLADLLEADAKNKKGIRFDLSVIAVRTDADYGHSKFEPGDQPGLDCGTAACAIGLACISGAFKRQGLGFHISDRGLEPEYEGVADFETAYGFFGLDVTEGDFLFLPCAYGKTPYGARGERAVAKRIREFVAGKVHPPENV